MSGRYTAPVKINRFLIDIRRKKITLTLSFYIYCSNNDFPVTSLTLNKRDVISQANLSRLLVIKIFRITSSYLHNIKILVQMFPLFAYLATHSSGDLA